jgi:putative ABC transport system substrate-binding protein
MTRTIGRRELLVALGGAMAVWPLAARAQQAAMPVIGLLSGRSPKDSAANVSAFQTGGGVTSTRAAMAATSSIPIIFVSGGDPIDLGLVESLNKPGGNLTGITFFLGALEAKRLELLHELLPKATLIGALVNPTFPVSKTRLEDAQAAAQALGKKLVVVHASTEGELKTAFTTLTQQRIEALDIIADPFLVGHAEQIVALAARNALPTISPLREFAVAGGVVSYGTSITEAHRLAGVYAGRILKGAKPADLPVQQPTKFELVINLKTAKALGLTIPTTLIARADR